MRYKQKCCSEQTHLQNYIKLPCFDTNLKHFYSRIHCGKLLMINVVYLILKVSDRKKKSSNFGESYFVTLTNITCIIFQHADGLSAMHMLSRECAVLQFVLCVSLNIQSLRFRGWLLRVDTQTGSIRPAQHVIKHKSVWTKSTTSEVPSWKCLESRNFRLPLQTYSHFLSTHTHTHIEINNYIFYMLKY